MIIMSLSRWSVDRQTLLDSPQYTPINFQVAMLSASDRVWCVVFNLSSPVRGGVRNLFGRLKKNWYVVFENTINMKENMTI